MNFAEALKEAQSRYGEDVYVSRKPRNGFATTNPVPSFLGEIVSPKGHNESWWVYKAVKNSNRQIGDRPKVAKAIRMDAGLADALAQASEAEGRSQIDIIEDALRGYLLR